MFTTSYRNAPQRALPAPFHHLLAGAALLALVCFIPALALAAGSSVTQGGTTLSGTGGGRDIFNGLNIAGSNTVIVRDGSGTNPGSIYGNAENGKPISNTLQIEGGRIGTAQSSHIIAGSYGWSDAATNNRFLMSGGFMEAITGYGSSIQLYGGSGETATDNTIAITGGTVNGRIQIFGGFGSAGEASRNKVLISTPTAITLTNSIWGGWAQTGDAANNEVNISTPLTIRGSITGAEANGGTATGNTVTLSGPTTVTNGSILGGSGTTLATGNTVTLSGPTTVTDGGITGAEANGGTATSNTVSLSGPTTVTDGGILGGWSKTGEATGNTVTLSGPTTVINGNILGGSGTTLATGNTVTLKDAPNAKLTLTGSDMWGGKTTTGDATSNKLIINAPLAFDPLRSIGGGLAEAGNAVDNAVEITSSVLPADPTATDSFISVYGGMATDPTAGAATGNSLHISGTDTVIQANVFGAQGTTTVSGNSVLIEGTRTRMTGSSIVGGEAQASATAGKADNNTVRIVGTDITVGSIFGGNANGSTAAAHTASGNSVTIGGSNTVVTGAVYGGLAAYSSTEASASVTSNNNTVNLESTGLVVQYGVIGGQAYNEAHGPMTASGNTVNITAPATIKGQLMGGLIYTETTPDGYATYKPVNTGNTLNLRTSGVKAGALGGFANYNFYLTSGVNKGDTLLHVTGDKVVDLSGATIGVGVVEGETAWKGGDGVTLINAAGGITPPANMTNTVTAMQGISLLHEFDLTLTGNLLNATIRAGEAGATPTPVATNIASSTRSSSMAATAMAADLAAGSGMDNARAAVAQANNTRADNKVSGESNKVEGSRKDANWNREEETRGSDGRGTAASVQHLYPATPYGLVPFAAVSGGRLKSDVGQGVTNEGVAFMTGLAKRVDLPASNLLAGVFFEAGFGRYHGDTSADMGSVTGRGDNHYTGGGLLARVDMTDTPLAGLYAEASMRVGRMNSDYKTDDVPGFSRVEYDYSNTYYGLHAGLGYLWQFADMAELDLYGKYFWSHQNGVDVRIAGDPWSFKSTDSHRVRTGARMNFTLGQHFTPYVGAAWEREFDNASRAAVFGAELPAVYAKGNSGMGEIGLKIRPNGGPFTADLSVQGYTGKKEGVLGNVNLSYEF